MTDKTTDPAASSGREASECSALLCAAPFFDVTKLKVSEYPYDFIPSGGELFIGVDQGSPDGDCTVKGFYKDGIFHVQEIERT